ncbi:MAG: preprotein translocase subunit YajC [Clostridiales bacterium]|nr:preprotein translocase subunit YajC [Clostridiales bacterium]
MDLTGIIRFVADGGAPAGNNYNTYIIMMIGMAAIIYFIILRPQNKQRKERETMISSLQVGDDVQTIGGIYGTITKIKQKTLYLRISDKVEIEILKTAVGALQETKDDAK